MTPEQFEEMMKRIDSRIDSKFKDMEDKAKAKADEEEKKRKEEEEKRKKAAEEDDLKKAEEEVKRRKEMKTQEELEKEKYLEAFKYNATIKDFLKDNAEYLPENLPEIINILEAKTYGNDVEKAQELKRAVVEQFIKEQKNLDILPDGLKSKAEKYAGFTTKEKLERALDFYDIVETGIHTAKNIKKAEAIEKGGNFGGDGKDPVKEYEESMLKFSQDAIAEGEGKK